jgi:light-regulated signal transduction histidine kinase (bacteriophytochrome)
MLGNFLAMSMAGPADVEDRIDITERKRMEELYRMNLDLQASNEELDAFGHTVAHDLKNPLGNIIGYAHLLTDEENPLPAEMIRDLARNFGDLSVTMDNIIEELMLLAGLRKATVLMRPLDARTVAGTQRRLASMIRASAREIKVPNRPGARLCPGSRDMDELHQQCDQICGSTHFGLGATQQGDQVRFWVSDNGAGLMTIERLVVPCP